MVPPPEMSEGAVLRRPRVHRTLNAVRWEATLTVRSFDIPLTVRVSHRQVLDDVVDQLPPGSHPARPSSGDHLFSVHQEDRDVDAPWIRLYRGDERIARVRDKSVALLALESALRFNVAESSRRWLFVHAGVVGWRGRAIVLPGVSGAGKTTLVRRLVEAGATYYSDEYAPIGEDGLVYPFAKPLSQRQAAPPGRRRVSAAAIGATVGVSPLPIGLVVATTFQAERTWTPRSMSAGEIMMALLANTVRARLDPPAVLQRLSRVAEQARGMEGVRGEADNIVADVLGRSE